MTYSIVARDPAAGQIGVAVQTALPGVGRLVPWAEAGVGAVATQALVRVSHGPSGLRLMRNGHNAEEALAAVITGDPGSKVRQLGMIDVHGKVDAFTGSGTIRYAGHHVGVDYAVQANMMASPTVPGAMSQAFEATVGQPLVMRMVAALEAAQDAGGDFRGQQSAALKVVTLVLPKNSWDGVVYDIRVDDDPQPVAALKRIATRYLAYNYADDAIGLSDKEDFDAAMQRFNEAVALDVDDEQMRFIFALNIADRGRFDLVEAVLQELIQQERWETYLLRVDEARPLQTAGLRDRILALKA